jgi:RNA polymerase sigma-70 factor (ECF subfamily)
VSPAVATVAAHAASREAVAMEDAPPPKRQADLHLVRRAQRGDGEALERLFRTHWPRGHRAAYLIVRDAAVAEDIAQEAFLAAVRTLDRFDRRRPFAPWFHRIVVNRAIDAVRARKLRGEVGDDAIERGVAARQPSSELSDETIAALGDLPDEQRAVVVMRYLLEYTPGEIARALDLPRGTVNSRLRRALDRLAIELEEPR